MNLNLEITKLSKPMMQQLLDRCGLQMIDRTSHRGDWDGSSVMLDGKKVGMVEPHRNDAYPIRMRIWTALMPFDRFTKLAYEARELMAALEAQAKADRPTAN